MDKLSALSTINKPLNLEIFIEFVRDIVVTQEKTHSLVIGLCRRGLQFKLTSWNLIVGTAHVDRSSPTFTLSEQHYVKGAKQ